MLHAMVEAREAQLTLSGDRTTLHLGFEGDLADARRARGLCARHGELMAYQHEGFWQCMDTIRDKVKHEALWDSGDAPWKVWR